MNKPRLLFKEIYFETRKRNLTVEELPVSWKKCYFLFDENKGYTS